MDLALSDDQERLVSVLQTFFAKESPPDRVRDAEPLGFDPALWSKFAELGGPGRLEQAGAHEDVHQGQRGQRRAERLADQREVEHGGARPDARAAQLGELAPQLRVEAERFGVADAIGRRLLGEERLEDGDQAFLVVAQGEIHGQPNTTRASPLGSTDTASPARRTSVVNRYWMTAGPYTAGPGASAWPS